MGDPLQPQVVIGGNLDDAIRNGPQHLRSIYRAVRDEGCNHLIVIQSDTPFPLIGEFPTIAIIGDDLNCSKGPAAFHPPSLKSLVEKCSAAVLMVGMSPQAYHHAASWAVLKRQHVVIVETRAVHELAWTGYLQATNPQLPILHVLDGEQPFDA